MSWATTFYYGQELRSLYMNNMINGLIRPGLYNIDATITTVSNEVTGLSPGIYLRLKAGSTFVFSNGYDVGEGNTYTRNLDKIGTYVVKCVLETTTDILLCTPADGASGVFLNNGWNAPVLFVYCKFDYDADGPGSMAPQFALAAPSSNTEFPPANWLPNEGRGGADFSQDEAYLILGALLDNHQDVPSAGEYATAIGGWNTGAETCWINNHVFTGRGFPDYRNSMFRTTETPVPTIASAPNYRNLYLTSGQFYFGSNLYNIDGLSWKRLYGQDTNEVLSVPTALTGYATDSVLNGENSITYMNAPDLALTANNLVLEFLFLALETEYSHIAYNPDGTIAPTDLTALLTSPDYALSRKLISYTVQCTYTGAIEWDTRELDSLYGITTSTVPLDVSKTNLARIRALLANRSLILPIIDHIRQMGVTQAPYLEPSVGDALLPIMITVRRVNSEGTDFTDRASSKALKAVNPANIISFFELQASTFAVTGVALAAEETYPTLPFLD